jgi:TP901 family phage tail tape measure protein
LALLRGGSMAGFDFTYSVGLALNTAGLTSAIQNVGSQISKAPIALKLAFPNIDTSQAGAYLSTIDSMAQSIDKVIVKQSVWTKAGQADVPLATKMLVTYTDKLGVTQQKWQALNVAVAAGLKTSGYAVTKGQDVVLNLSKAEALLNTEINGNLKSFDAMSKKAGDWYSRSEKMSGKEKEAIQSTTTALQTQVRAYGDALRNNDLAGAKGLVPGILAANQAMEQQISASKRAAMGVRSWGESISNAIKQTISYALSLGLIRTAQQLLNTAIKYTIDLNKEMVNIQILQVEGAKTDAEIKSLAASYNQLAVAMGTTTLEIAKGSVEWLRQGRTIRETTELMKASTMLSKLGAMSAADATENLTSTINSYKMATSDAVSIVDKLIAVDNKSATSAREMATAIRYVAAVASETGVTLESLISYIATISSVTRLNAEQIGQSLKTIFTRMQDIRAGKIDEDGLGINNTAIALQRVGVQLMENSTTFRDFSTVLEEIAAKWSTLNDVEQANISKAIAGVRQANMFRILMQNMNQALGYQEIQTNAAGVAMDRYQIYLKSVETAQNRLTSSLQGLWQDGIKSGLIVNVLNATTSIIQFIDSIGGLNTILAVTAIVVLAVKWEAMALGIINVVQAINLAVAAYAGGFSLIASVGIVVNPWIIALAAVVALGAGLYYLSQEAERNQKAWEDATQALEESSNAYKQASDAKGNVQELWQEFDTLRKKIELTTDEAKRLVEVQNELNQLSGGLITGYYDDKLNFHIAENASIDATIKLLQQELDLKLQIALEDAKAAALAGEDVYQDNKAKLKLNQSRAPIGRTGPDIATPEEEAIRRRDRLVLELAQQKQINLVVDTYRKISDIRERAAFKDSFMEQDIIDAINEYDIQQARETAETIYRNNLIKKNEGGRTRPTPIDTSAYLTGVEAIKVGMKEVDDVRQKLINGEFVEQATLDRLGLTLDSTSGKYLLNEESAKNRLTVLLEEQFGYAALTELQQANLDIVISEIVATKDLAQEKTNLNKEIDSLNNAMKEQVDNESLSADTVLSLIESHSVYADAIDYENGLFSINKARLKDIINAQIVEQTTALILAKTTLFLAEAEVRSGKSTGFAAAASIVRTAALRGEILSIQATLNSLNAALSGESWSSGSGSGGQSAADKAKKAAQDEYDARIKIAEAEKAALKQKLDDYKKIIDARKAILKSMKDEVDYQDTLRDKSHSVAKIQNELLALSLDNSEEARARRLQLEEELAKAKEDLDKTQTDRAYELQIEALDKEYEAYENMINGQMELLDEFIQSLKDALDEIIDRLDKVKGGNGVGGSMDSTDSTVPSSTPTGTIQTSVHNATYADYAAYLKAHPVIEPIGYIPNAEGGLITGGTSGRDSVPTMAMPGEFMLNKNAVAAIGISTLNSLNAGSRNSIGDIHFSMPINVMGNLDKTVLPDLEKLVNRAMEKMNATMRKRGITRAVNQYSN